MSVRTLVAPTDAPGGNPDGEDRKQASVPQSMLLKAASLHFGSHLEHPRGQCATIWKSPFPILPSEQTRGPHFYRG